MTSPAYTADELWSLATGESDVFTMDFTDALATGETLSAISGTVSSNGSSFTLGVTATGITLGTPTINSGSIAVDDATIAASKAVQVRITAPSGTVGKIYEVTFTASTSGSNVLQQIGRLEVLG